MEPDSAEIDVEGEEERVEHRVRYIHNGYILDYMAKQKNAATSRMLVSLPLCPSGSEKVISGYLFRLKTKRANMLKNRTEKGISDLKAFLDAEFVFPEPSGVERYKYIGSNFKILL